MPPPTGPDALEPAAERVGSEQSASSSVYSSPRALRCWRVASTAVLGVSRLNLMNRHAQQIAGLIGQMVASRGGEGLTLNEWREGCLSQPEVLHILGAARERQAEDEQAGAGAADVVPVGRETSRRGAPHQASAAHASHRSEEHLAIS